jgi:toxin CcdB
MKDLTPVVDIDGGKYLLLVPQLAGIAANELGPAVSNVSSHRDEIVAALDFLITGV